MIVLNICWWWNINAKGLRFHQNFDPCSIWGDIGCNWVISDQMFFSKSKTWQFNGVFEKIIYSWESSLQVFLSQNGLKVVLVTCWYLGWTTMAIGIWFYLPLRNFFNFNWKYLICELQFMSDSNLAFGRCRKRRSTFIFNTECQCQYTSTSFLRQNQFMWVI